MTTVPETSIFTKIIQGEISGFIPYQTDTITVLIALEGHILIVPKQQYKDIFELPDEIAAEIHRNKLTQPKFATDSILDYFNGPVVRVMTYEKTGRLVDAQELLATSIMNIPKTTAMGAFEAADYALVTISHPSTERNPVYPFQRNMIEYRRDIATYAQAHMVPMRRVQIGDHVFQFFQRP